MSDRVCRLCNMSLVRREGERAQAFALRLFCNNVCKYKRANELERERKCAVPHQASAVMDFSPHEIVPRDGGYMTRINRALPERSLIGCSAAWAVGTGGE